MEHAEKYAGKERESDFERGNGGLELMECIQRREWVKSARNETRRSS